MLNEAHTQGCVCVCACVRVCMRAFVCVCVCVTLYVYVRTYIQMYILCAVWAITVDNGNIPLGSEGYNMLRLPYCSTCCEGWLT